MIMMVVALESRIAGVRAVVVIVIWHVIRFASLVPGMRQAYEYV